MPGTQIDLDAIHELAKQNNEATGKLTEAVATSEKERGTFSKETRSAIEKHTSELQEIAKRAADIEKAISDLQTTLNRDGTLPGGAREIKLPKSVGDLYLESEQYKAVSKRQNVQSSDWVDIGSFQPHLDTVASQEIRRMREIERRAGNILSSTNLTDLVGLLGTLRMTEVMRTPFEQARLTDFMTVLPMSQNTLEYPRVSQFNLIYTEVASSAASGQAVVNVDNAVGFRVGATVVIARGTGAVETKVILSIAANAITLTTNLANTHAADVSVDSDSYDYTPEAMLKPMAQHITAVRTVSMKTLATWIPVTNQMLADLPMLRPLIEDELMDALRQQRERNLLYGNGSDTQLTGLFTDPLIQTYSWSSGVVGDTELDAVRRAMTPVRLAHLDVDLIVVNPQDWEKFELVKASDGHYLLSTGVVGAQRRLWATPVLATTNIEPGDVAIGAFRSAWYLDREMGRISVGQPNDYFLKNMQAILAEERGAAAWRRPESFCHLTLDSAPV